jgi:hypothetical protein
MSIGANFSKIFSKVIGSVELFDFVMMVLVTYLYGNNSMAMVNT